MPFTPFHFGPGAAVRVICGESFSFTIFAAAQVLIDLEPGYHILRGDSRFHGWAHTYLGATVLAVVCAFFVAPLCDKAAMWYRKRALPFASWFTPKRHSLRVAMVSAFVGTLSHVLLDSFMHADMEPFWPFSPLNPMLGVASYRGIQLLCLGLGVAAVVVAAVKSKTA